MNDVSDTFTRFLKMVRNQAKISTRELAEVANKSTAYVSILENGKIKTIDFTTAYKMLEYINEKKPFITGSINGDSSSGTLVLDMLINRFNIMPEEFIERELIEAENQQKEKLDELKKIGEKMGIIRSLIDEEYLVDLLLVIAQANIDQSYARVLSNCLSILTNPKKAMPLRVLENIITSNPGVFSPCLDNKHIEDYYREMEQLQIKYNYKEGK
jgi:transcriptional regulator with XRE-family HTH domain